MQCSTTGGLSNDKPNGLSPSPLAAPIEQVRPHPHTRKYSDSYRDVP